MSGWFYNQFLPNQGETQATGPLVTILREGRQPGISLVLASQQPGKIHTDVMTQADTIRVLAFGDSGWGSASQVRLARSMASEPWDLAVHVGDIAYHGGSEIDYTERHFAIYRELLARVPFFPSIGNHDVIENGGASYDRAFVWPAPTPGAPSSTWSPLTSTARPSSCWTCCRSRP